MLGGLRTQAMVVQDVEAAKRWYADVLGYEPYFDQPFYVGFDVAGYELGIQPAGDRQPGLGGVTVLWAVDDVATTVTALVDRGATVLSDARDVGDGIVVASLQDPFGNALGLIRNPHFRAAEPAAVVVVADGARLAAAGDALSSRQIVQTVDVAQSPDEVWRLWTTSEGMTSWLTDATIDLEIGGAFELRFMPDAPAGTRGSEGCRILSYLPGRMLSFTWNAPPSLPTTRHQRTWVVVELDPVDGGTRVRLTHIGWPASGWSTPGSEWPATFDYFTRAWGGVAAALAAHCGAL